MNLTSSLKMQVAPEMFSCEREYRYIGNNMLLLLLEGTWLRSLNNTLERKEKEGF